MSKFSPPQKVPNHRKFSSNKKSKHSDDSYSKDENSHNCLNFYRSPVTLKTGQGKLTEYTQDTHTYTMATGNIRVELESC